VFCACLCLLNFYTSILANQNQKGFEIEISFAFQYLNLSKIIQKGFGLVFWIRKSKHTILNQTVKDILITVLAIIVGGFIGGIVNGSLIMLGLNIFPADGIDVMDPNNAAQYAEFLSTAGVESFVFPYLAHAIGTLVGATIAFVIAGKKYKKIAAYIIGGFFLIGGIMAVNMYGGPIWYKVLDLGTAYIPMAWLGTIIGSKFVKEK